MSGPNDSHRKEALSSINIAFTRAFLSEWSIVPRSDFSSPCWSRKNIPAGVMFPTALQSWYLAWWLWQPNYLLFHIWDMTSGKWGNSIQQPG